MQISYVFHSCFVVETDSVIIVYDYWMDGGDADLLHRLSLSDKSVYFVVSHFHMDHFNAVIFNVSNAVFLLSYDVVKRNVIPDGITYHVLRPGHVFKDHCLEVHAFRSTDIGVCTLLLLPHDDSVFHAGDCNNWYFNEGQSLLKVTPEYMDKLFLSVLRDIRKVVSGVGHVMFPIDPRLGPEFLRGVVQWLDTIQTECLYPMHFWDKKQMMLQGLEILKEKYPDTFFYVP